MNARAHPAHLDHPHSGWPPHAWRDAPEAASLPTMALVETITLPEARIPVWAAADSAADGKFVCYSDMPAELAAAFREQQVLAGHPFAGAAYIEDFQLFIELRQRRIRMG